MRYSSVQAPRNLTALQKDLPACFIAKKALQDLITEHLHNSIVAGHLLQHTACRCKLLPLLSVVLYLTGDLCSMMNLRYCTSQHLLKLMDYYSHNHSHQSNKYCHYRKRGMRPVNLMAKLIPSIHYLMAGIAGN